MNIMTLIILATVGWIILGIIIIVAILIGIICFLIYAVAFGIGHKNETEASAWLYWETHKIKAWSELSDEEKEKMVIANLIIADDVGAVVTKEEIVKILEEQPPITEPHIGLSFS